MSEFESLELMARSMAGALDQAASHFAFQLFRDREFRRLAQFDRLAQVEHDRIFNELLVAHLELIMLTLEAPDLRSVDELKEFLTLVKDAIPEAHLDNLKSLGVAEEHLRDWDKLIALRYDEYSKDRHSVRAAAMELESAEKDLDVGDLSKIQLLVPVQAVAIGCHHHICRQKTDGRDDLFRHTLQALARFYVEIRVRFEGGEITPLMRARAKLKRMFGPNRPGHP